MPHPTLRLPGLPPIRVSLGTVATVLILGAMIQPSLVVPGERSSAQAALLAGIIAVLMILCVLAHEIAHAVAARSFGAQVDHIALTLWGGHTQYRAEVLRPGASIVISLAGPAANFLIVALIRAGLAVLVGGGSGGGSDLVAVLGATAWLNLALGVFNLLPGLPMDGGRALEGILALVFRDRARATVVTAWLGRLIAIAVIALPLVSINRRGHLDTASLLVLLWAVLIAGLLWQGAGSALQQARMDQRADSLNVRTLLHPGPILSPDEPVSAWSPAGGIVIDPQHGPRGRIGIALFPQPDALRAVPDTEQQHTPLSAVCAPLGSAGTISVDLTGRRMITHMLSYPHAAYIVVDEQGATLGHLLTADANAALRGTRSVRPHA